MLNVHRHERVALEDPSATGDRRAARVAALRGLLTSSTKLVSAETEPRLAVCARRDSASVPTARSRCLQGHRERVEPLSETCCC